MKTPAYRNLVRNDSVRLDSDLQVTLQLCNPVVDAETRFSVQLAADHLQSIAEYPDEVHRLQTRLPERGE